MMNRFRPGVRWTHLPTGITAECREERSMHKCGERALGFLKAKVAAQRAGIVPTTERVRTYTLDPRWAAGMVDARTKARFDFTFLDLAADFPQFLCVMWGLSSPLMRGFERAIAERIRHQSR